jgi:hypothetical protein
MLHRLVGSEPGISIAGRLIGPDDGYASRMSFFASRFLDWARTAKS